MDKANALGNMEQKPVISLKSLEPEKPYQLYDLKYIDSKFGKCLLAEIDEGVVFLPKRLNSLTEEEIDSMLSSSVGIVFGGFKNVGKYDNIALVKFVKL